MARRPLFIGEGTRDVGDATAQIGGEYEGDLPRLVRRLVIDAGGPERFGYATLAVRDYVPTVARGLRPSRAGGKGVELRQAVIGSFRDKAADQRPLAVVALIDARADELKNLRDDVRSILTECAELDASLPVAIGLAVQEIEIWMLADSESRVHAFGRAIAVEFRCDDHEAERDPKSRWEMLAGQTEVPAGSTHAQHHDRMRRVAWESLRPDVVRRLCPQGFAPFAAALVRALAGLIPAP